MVDCLMCGKKLTVEDIANSVEAGSDARCSECEWEVVLKLDKQGKVA